MVVDELVVTLGLDPKKFNEGQRKALDGFKTTVEEFKKQGQQAEYQSKNLSDSLSGARSQALKLFAVVSGGVGLAAFAENAIRSTAATARLSHGVSVSVTEISKLQGLVKTFGGDAGEAAQTVVSLSDALADMKMGQISPLVTTLRALSSSGGVTVDPNSGPLGVLSAVADNLKNIREKYGSDVAGDFGRRLGLSPALFEALIDGAARFNEQLAKIKGMSEADGQAALALQQQWDSTLLSVENYGKRIVTGIAPEVSKALKTDLQDLEAIATLGQKVRNYWGGKGFVADTPVEPTPATTGSTTPATRFSSQSQKEAFIRAEATKRGMDPDVAMAVARSEGFNSFSGDNGTSGGAFQLHVTPGGRGRAVGDEFKSKTGLDPLDPANEARAIQFALDDAKAHGWSAYHGAARTGISDWKGIDRGGAGGASSTITNVNGPINISVPAGQDPQAFASAFTTALKRQASATQSNGGQN